MTMRLKRSLATLLASVMYLQPIAQNTFAFAATPAPEPASTSPAVAGSPSVEEIERTAANPPAEIVQEQVVVFGPKTYVRTAGAPNIYNETFTIPAGVTGPFTMHVVNGSANGDNRLSSSTILLNGVEVAVSGDFGQQIAGFDKTVSLQASNQVEYRVTSIPLGFMVVTFYGANGNVVTDTTAPQVAITSPQSGSFSNASSTQITLQASDPAGASGEPVSGINQSSLHVVIDDVDRTSDFTWSGGQASASIASLPEGDRTITASIADNAGNNAPASTVTFKIDRTAPVVTIIDPSANQFTNASSIEVSGGVDDASATTVTVDGAPVMVDNGAFTAAGVQLGNEPTQTITVTATDAAGNTSSATVTVNIDRVSPALTVTSPAETVVVLTGPQITVSGTVTDEHIALLTVNDQPIQVNSDGTFEDLVPLPDGDATLTVKAHDLAGNETTVVRSFVIDSVAPVITITEPQPYAITNHSPIIVRGTATDERSAVTVTAGGQTVTPQNGVFELSLPLFSEGTTTLIVTATDAAGNQAVADVSVTFDHTAPELTITNPTGDVVKSVPLTVQGTVKELITDVTVKVNGSEVPVSGQSWTTTLDSLDEGQTTITVSATDGAGNSISASKSFLVDLNAPIVTIASPSGGTMTDGESIAVSGTVQDISVPAITVNGISVTLDPPSGSPRPFTVTVPLTEGDNNIIAFAKDAADRETTAQVSVTRDSTAPTVELSVAPKVSKLRPASADIIASDNIGLDLVTVSVNGAIVETFTAPPFALNISAPENAKGGDTVTVVAEAIDRLGHRSQSSATIAVVSDGAIVGQVLTDVDGLPMKDAVIAVDGISPLTSDERGRYTFAAHDTHIALSITKTDHTSVDRSLDVAAETGSAVVDARLTKLLPATAVGSSASTIDASPSIAVVVQAGTFADGSTIRVTPLSGQGLPGLLPLGWSPIAAVDVRGSMPALPLRLRVSNAGSQTLYLARYTNRSWYLASDVLTPDQSGVVIASLPSSDAVSVALVAVDTGDGAPSVPAFGDPLPGAAAAAIPLTATSTGVLDPPILSPNGGTSIGTLTITSPTPLPSGTVVQANVTETFSLINGDAISNDARTEDFILYRAPSGLVATFPVVPSRQFDASTLAQGVVHLDILAGRESVRGSAGGNGSLTLTTTGATLSIAQGALTTGDVPIGFQSAVLSTFLPVTADVSPLLEFVIDLSGRELSIGADLSVLASQLPAPAGDDALVVARIDSLDGRSRLVPVAIGELVGDRYFARAIHGLAGITKGGRHVWYRVANGVGFVRGSIEANGSPLTAIVETLDLPFAMRGEGGQFAIVSRPGTVTVRARAPGSSLAGEESVSVNTNVESTANITLAGEVTNATITPANGAIGVSIAAQIEVTSAVSITAGSLTNAAIVFERTGDQAGPVAYRAVLSGSGRSLAIVPQARLAEGGTYAISISGLSDAVGGAVVVPSITFTTQDTSAPVYHPDQLVFSFPDEQGRVTLTGPPDTLAPGSSILVINESTGEVATIGVNNDGSVGGPNAVGGDLVAQLSDRLIVTITDLQGRTVTFKRSTYVKEDGTTAVGNGGGTIVGDGGVELRVPEDAVMQGMAAILKIAAIPVDQLPDGALPEGSTAASVLKMEVPQGEAPPEFQKEVDLVFPKPAGAPDGAVYVVYRRLDGQLANGDPTIAYESLDYATVEDNKVVTASYPFSGYRGGGPCILPLGAVCDQSTNYGILSFLYDEATPGAALGGTITGKVLRVKWDPGAATPTYEPVKGALVSGVDASGQPLFSGFTNGSPATVAVSQADGTYSLFDRQYTGGPVTISATVDGATRTATAYEVDPQTTKSTALRYSKNVATANITFPAVAPAVPPSPVRVTVVTLDDNNARKLSNGIVVAGDQIVIGITAGDNTIQRVEVKNGSQITEYGVRVDPLRPQAGSFDVIAENAQPLATAGSYTITAYALNPGGGVVSGYAVVRATAAGGGNNDALPNDAPAVITARTVPKENATGVQIGALPQIVFTEPVQNIPNGLTLTEEGSTGTVDIGVVISGVGPSGPIANLTPQSVVTSITIQPSAGLKYGTRYTVSLSDAIFDTDDGANGTAAHKALVPYTASFTTFTPESIGQTTDLFTAGGMTVIGDRAYIASPQNLGRYFTNLRLFDVSDPTSPFEIASTEPNGSQVFKAPPVFWLGLPVDVVSQEESSLTGGPVVAVATTPLTYPYHTSSVRLYDVSNEQQWKWIGAVSLGRDPSDGMIRRIEMKDTMLYAVTAGIGKGIQFVDLNAVKDAFDTALADGESSTAYWQMLGKLNSTEGFAQEAIISTVHVDTGLGENSQLWDLAVTDLSLNGISQPTVIATGRHPLAIATLTDGLIYNGDITDGQGGPALTSWGYGIAAGTIAGKSIAVVSAMGVSADPSVAPSAHVLAIVDLTNPLAPARLALLDLPGSAAAVQDVVLRDTTVFVATNSGTYVVNLASPSTPLFVGTLSDISGRLAFNNSIVLSTRRGLTETTSTSGGLRAGALGAVAIVRSVEPIVVNLDDNDRTTEPIKVRYQLLGTGAAADKGSVLLSRNGTAVLTAALTSVTDGAFEVEIPPGVLLSTPSDALSMSLKFPDGRLTDPFTTIIDNPSASSSQDVELEQTLVDIEPSLITRGLQNILVTAHLANPESVRFVSLTNAVGSVTTAAFKRTSTTSGTFIVPAEFVEQPGIVRVDFGSLQRAMLFVATPGLPLPGVDASSSVTEVVPENLLDAQGSLRIYGNGFLPGSKVLLGRSQRSALILDTEFIEEDTLVATLPAVSLASDLFVTVMSPDGQIASAAFAVAAEGWRDRPGHLEPEDVRLSSIKGSLVWNRGPQSMAIDAFNLPDGTTAILSRPDDPDAVELPLEEASAPTTFAALVSGPAPEKKRVVIPAHMTDYPAFDARVEVSGETIALQSSRSFFVPQEPFAIPFGGRKKFIVRRDAATGAPVLLVGGLPRPAPGVSVDRRLLPGDPVTVTVTTVPEPNRPDIQVERDNDIELVSFFIRGLRLTTNLDTKVNRGVSRFTISNGTSSGTFTATVVGVRLGDENNDHDADIRKVADRYGIPPQFLKSQVGIESGFLERSYRYEPTTVDLRYLSGDLTIVEGSPDNLTPTVTAGDADSTIRWIDIYPFNSYRLAGPRLDSIARLAGNFQRATALPDGTYSIGTEILSRAGEIKAGNRRARIELRVPNSSRKIDQSVEPFSIWTKNEKEHAGRAPKGPQEFSVDYATGIIRLGAPLQPGEVLEVKADPPVTVFMPTSGPYTGGFNFAKASEQYKLSYSPSADTIATFFDNNFQIFADGRWFGTDSERQLEFRFDSAAKRPTLPVDTRYHKAMAQYFAGASYGPLQLTLLPWTDGRKKAQFDPLLKVQDEPIYEAVMNWDRGLSLGAAFHRSSAQRTTFSCPTVCNEEVWQKDWASVFSKYDVFAPRYALQGGLNVVILNARKYEPH